MSHNHHKNNVDLSEMTSREAIADRIDTIIEHYSKSGDCLCGRGESCERCNSHSGLNKVLHDLRYMSAELNGCPIQEPTLEDYSRTIQIERSEIGL